MFSFVFTGVMMWFFNQMLHWAKGTICNMNISLFSAYHNKLNNVRGLLDKTCSKDVRIKMHRKTRIFFFHFIFNKRPYDILTWITMRCSVTKHAPVTTQGIFYYFSSKWQPHVDIEYFWDMYCSYSLQGWFWFVSIYL